MFYKDGILNDYFCWLIDIIANGYEQSRFMLLKQLFDTSFVYSLERDANRAHDGLDLRDQYSAETGNYLDISRPCSVLEMMVALAIRCETDIMYNPAAGNRTSIWFWMMIENLGLIYMTDQHHNKLKVKTVLSGFLNRTYDPDGKGSLFYIPGARGMQNEEIWYQMNTYLNSIVR